MKKKRNSWAWNFGKLEPVVWLSTYPNPDDGFLPKSCETYKDLFRDPTVASYFTEKDVESVGYVFEAMSQASTAESYVAIL